MTEQTKKEKMAAYNKKRYLENKEYYKSKSKKWTLENRERKAHLTKCTDVKRRYGISIERYNECMATSDVCECCGSKKNLQYDHCHGSMDFRGVLCGVCNKALGALGDTLEGAKKAVAYHEKVIKRNKEARQ